MAWSKNYRRFTCTGKHGGDAEGASGCGFSMTKIPAGRSFELPEVEQLLREHKLGPLEGFRSKAGWPFTAELKLVRDDELNNWKMEFDFGEDAKKDEEAGEAVDFSGHTSLGTRPKCKAMCMSTAPTTCASTRWARPLATSRVARSSAAADCA